MSLGPSTKDSMRVKRMQFGKTPWMAGSVNCMTFNSLATMSLTEIATFLIQH
jgi:hypothetical protein